MKTLTTLLITVVAFGVASGQESQRMLPPSIQASGEGRATAAPDQAQIDVGVVTQASTSQAAVEQNARQVDATLTRLRGVLGAGADIKTISYTVQPNYRYPREGGEPTITGYTATNIVRATISDLTQVGRVIDAAAQGGSNRIQNLRFTLKNERPIQAEALREAAANARAKVDTLASALGLRIVRVLSVTESGPTMVPLREVSFARSDAAATPIEPGTIEVRATVSITVEVAQR